MKFGDTYGKRFGLNYEVEGSFRKWSPNEEGCANLNPFLYPFPETPGGTFPGDTTLGNTKGDKSAKKGKKEKGGEKGKKSKKGKADKKR